MCLGANRNRNRRFPKPGNSSKTSIFKADSWPGCHRLSDKRPPRACALVSRGPAADSGQGVVQHPANNVVSVTDARARDCPAKYVRFPGENYPIGSIHRRHCLALSHSVAMGMRVKDVAVRVPENASIGVILEYRRARLFGLALRSRLMRLPVASTPRPGFYW